jgi:hypothetical protein
MTNCISGCQRAARIAKMKVTNATSAIPSTPPAGDDGPRLNSRCLIWELVMSTARTVRVATMWMQMGMTRKKHRKLMMDQCRMWRTAVLVGDVDGYE